MPSRIRDVLSAFRSAARGFFEDDGFNLAAGMAFFALLSLIPLILIAISLFGHFLGQEEALFRQIVDWMQTTIPGVKAEFVLSLRSLIDKKLSVGWLGIGFLFFAASLLFTNIEHALDKVMRNAKRRNFWHSQVFSILVLIFTILLFFVPAQLNLILKKLPTPSWLLTTIIFMTGNFSYFISHGLVFFLLVFFIPNKAISVKNIAWGSLLFASLTVLMRQLFHWYMGLSLERYHLIYGSLSMLVILLLWIYYLSAIFIYCSEWIHALEQRRAPPIAGKAEAR